MKKKPMKANFGIVRISILLVLAILTACGDDGSRSPRQPAAVITSQPADQSVLTGTTATFIVVASNAISYQWQISTDSGGSFSDINNAIAADYTTAVTAVADSGTQYRVVVSGAGNSVTSSAVTLTVTATPATPGISVHPADQTITEGQNASFSVTATGTTLGYQWQISTDGGVNFADIADAINATLTLTAVPLADNAHQFRVVVSNSFGSVTSNAASLSVNSAQVSPAFSTQPVDQSVVAMDTATFNVVVTGSPMPTLQWQLSTNAGSSFTDIVDATASSYTTAVTNAGDNGNQYRVIATNAAGTIISNTAMLTISEPSIPSFTTQPADISITEGQNAQFMVAVTGTPTPTLQWQLSTDSGSNWSNINGATSPTYTTAATIAGDNGHKFRAVATNSVASVNSNAATLTVTTNYAWGPAPNHRFVDIRTTTEYASYVDFAMNTTGDAIAIWLQNDGTRNNLWANRFTVSNSQWGTPVLIEMSVEDITTLTNPLEGPRVAINADGSAVAVWVHAPSNVVWANHYTVAGGWGDAQPIDAAVAAGQHSRVPRIAIDDNGNAIAVWYRHDGTRFNVRANIMAADGTWGDAGVLENENTQNAVYPSVAMNADGKAVVAWNWLAANFTDYLGVAATYYDGVSWNGVVNLPSGVGAGTAGTSAKPEVGMDSSGNAIAVWKQVNSSILNIRASSYDSNDGSWEESTIIDNLESPAFDVNLAVNPRGEAAAVWIQYDNSNNPDTHANRFNPSTGWETASLVESFTQQSAISPRVAIDPAGNAMALMGRITSPQPGRLRANGAPAGEPWGSDVAVDGTSYPDAPASWRLAMDGSGRAMALWVQTGPTGAHFRVYYNRYE